MRFVRGLVADASRSECSTIVGSGVLGGDGFGGVDEVLGVGISSGGIKCAGRAASKAGDEDRGSAYAIFVVACLPIALKCNKQSTLSSILIAKSGNSKNAPES
eukprot:scaffold4677_cov98-Cyclotella_meneghiniana.AAC.1